MNAFFGLKSTAGGIDIHSLSDVNNVLPEWIDLGTNSSSMSSRLEFILGKVKLIENNQITRSRNAPTDNNYLVLQVYDLGGQDRFTSIGEAYLKLAKNGILFFYDTSQSQASQLTLDQLWEKSENVKPRNSYVYVLSKNDVIASKNNFVTDLDVNSYPKAGVLMPLSSLDAWDNDGVVSSLGSLILSNFNPNESKYTFAVAGVGHGGKSTLLNKFCALLCNDKSMVKPTKMTVGPDYVSLGVNSSVFYAHDVNDNMYFVKDSGEVAFYVNVRGHDNMCSISSFAVLDKNYSELSMHPGVMWGSVIGEFIDNGLHPVYDLKILSRIAQFMVPEKWGLSDSYKGFFPDKKEFLKSRHELRINDYIAELGRINHN